MQHKISQLCDKISVMYNKSMELRRAKYDTPKLKQDQTKIAHLITDIQALAGDIHHDKEQHPKLKEKIND
jgi:hypothetical protein|tara:strand:+ start:744 stop:953 length:210 start_codon:yes stop_codon:yes gene_type:complete